MSYTLIAAMDNNQLIGADGDLPWRLPKDLQLFKQHTLGKKILMGRKTCESLPGPLPGRKNYVLSRSNFSRDGFICINNSNYLDYLNEEVMVIGGAGIYQLFLPKATAMILTFINHEFSGDTYFPQWETELWQEKNAQHYLPDDKNNYEFWVRKYIKISS
ncbi:dihydrofolate reductase [Marinicella sp. W31]|uniref:dihydrofolate reductase n=1 Tax=Marinicella sp. W31 TaxID=3023713 RepID=UPI00375729ED